jgi:Zn-dependent peptidase ImmA (M78 family)/transcriptional regulator with XRE-family HTH domain
MTDIPVVGRVVTWAREFRGLSLDEAADRIGVTKEQLEEIETEVCQPSLTRFEKMASVYRLPLATLFRRTPPPAPPELADFRTFESAAPQNSFDFRVALSNVRTLQATLSVIRSDDQNFYGATLRQYDLARDPFQQGENERQAIGVSVRQQLDWGAGEGFRRWRAIVERLGISVYLQAFELNDCRGCAIFDDGATPAILINKNEISENARTYTLIHEYAHLLVRRPGISDLNRRNPVEMWCNRFAAAFLMPVTALRQVFPNWPDGPQDWPDATIHAAARALNVSAQALAIRLEELGRAHDGLNRKFIHRAAPKKSGKVSYVTKRLSEIGGRYTASVIGALDRDIIDAVHASQALALKPTSLDDARAYVHRQRELADAE